MPAHSRWILQNKEFFGGKQNIKRRQICWVKCSLWIVHTVLLTLIWKKLTMKELTNEGEWLQWVININQSKGHVVLLASCGEGWDWLRCREKRWKVEQDNKEGVVLMAALVAAHSVKFCWLLLFYTHGMKMKEWPPLLCFSLRLTGLIWKSINTMHAHSILTHSYWKLAHLNFLPLGNQGSAFKIHIFMSLLFPFY